MLKTDKAIKRIHFTAKLEVVSGDGSYTIPFENWEDAEAEMKKYTDGDNAVHVHIEDWDDSDRAWWSEKKMLLVSSFGHDYLDDNNCLGMLKMFQPAYKIK